jgi:hypothetical protein
LQDTPKTGSIKTSAVARTVMLGLIHVFLPILHPNQPPHFPRRL